MLILGLTGGIACGKSHISDTLRGLGAAVVDGDRIARELTAPDGPALAPIRREFGGGVFRADGTLDRAALGRIVFADAEALGRLNDLMRPLLRGRIDAEVEAARARGERVCVLDMPLLYEEGLDARCRRVWCAVVPPQVQLERLRVRDGLSAEEAADRVRSQLPVSEKACRADVVIDTDRPMQDTEAAVRALYAGELLREEGERHAG